MIRRTTMAVLLALALVAAACASGGTPQAEGPTVMALTPTTVAPSVASDSGDSDATAEGVKVHGHWEIEVRNPDGSLDHRREFDNALLASGAGFLASLMVGDAEVVNGEPWAIFLSERSCSESNYDWTVGTTSSAAGGSINLEGSGVPVIFPTGDTMSVDTNMTSVFTVVFEPSGSLLPNPVGFTCKDIPALTIAPNQSVYVEVEISFS